MIASMALNRLERWMSRFASMAHNRLEKWLPTFASRVTKFLTDFP